MFKNDIGIYNAADGTYQGAMKNVFNIDGKLCFRNGQLMVLSSRGIAFKDIVE